ncbi:MAG: type II toxin-antitoxin system RelB/DinJ family antitoxin [Candidatus Falkowbacteria bacterium]
MNNQKTMTQLQVRIDKKTKDKAKIILEDLGMDLSTAVKILFKQIVRAGAMPVELRDVNGFRPHKARELKEAIKDAENSKKTYTSVDELMAELES